MARSPIEIAIASETKAFKQGIETGIIRPTEDAIKTLRDLGQTDAADKLERELRAAQHATTKLGDETKKVAAAIERDYKDAYRSAKKASDDGLDGMKGKSAEVGSELRQNLGETFSSFKGDLADLPQIAQDTLGGLAGSGALGGIPGLAATAAGAAGLGLLTAAFQQINEDQELAKQRAQEWADAYIESGGRVLSFDQQMGKAKDILNNKYDELKKNAELWGVSEQTALAAMTGSGAAIDTVTKNLDAQKASVQAAADAIKQHGDKTGEATAKLSDSLHAYQDGKAAIDKQTTAMEQGAKIADVYSYYLADVAKTTQGATTAVDEFGDSVTTLPDGKKIYIDAETGRATEDTDAIEKKIYGLQDKTVNVRVNADTSAATAAFDALQRRVSKGINVSFNNSGRMLME